MSTAAHHSLLSDRKERWGSYLVGSVVAHALVLGGMWLTGSAFGGHVIDLDQKPIQASLVRLGKPRDQKLLPRKEEPPPPPKKVEGAEAPPVPAPPDKAVAVPIPGVKPTEKNTPKKEGEKQGEDARRRLFNAMASAGKKAEELEGAADGDPLGDSAIQEGERYFGLITAQVRRYYDVSNTIPEQERMQLRAQVNITIARAGELLGVKLVKPSGNGLFDAAVLAAVKRAAPYSPPPEHLRSQLQRTGVTFEFTP